MNIAGYNIKPIALFLDDEEKWKARHQSAKEHFEQVGIDDIYWLNGIHYGKFQIEGTGIYILDNKEKNIAEKFNVGKANTANFLSQYSAYLVMDALGKHTNFKHFFYVEDDARFVPEWKEKLELALQDIPKDFDFLYVGSCCCTAKNPQLISKRSNLYYINKKGDANWHYNPVCTHAYIVSHKCIKFLLETQRDCSAPTDISLAKFSLPYLNTYVILPRLADQFNTELQP